MTAEVAAEASAEVASETAASEAAAAVVAEASAEVAAEVAAAEGARARARGKRRERGADGCGRGRGAGARTGGRGRPMIVRRLLRPSARRYSDPDRSHRAPVDPRSHRCTIPLVSILVGRQLRIGGQNFSPRVPSHLSA